MSARLDIMGRRFGRLTALKFSSSDGKYAHWRVRCDCGAEFDVRGTSLTSGNTTQCVACQRLATRGNRNARKHGHSSASASKPSPTYESWKAMWARVTNPNNASWEHYGAKGVTAYEGWRDFEAFLAHHGERPPGTTLDRFPDKAGNYVPGNTRWATPQQQRDNQNEPARKRQPEDLAGLKFGRLSAVRLSHVRNGHAYFLCLCDCGKEKIAPSHNLKRGRVASCGCLRRGDAATA